MSERVYSAKCTKTSIMFNLINEELEETRAINMNN